MGINGGEFIVLIILAMIILGPERLPEYASKLADLVKSARAMATDAKAKIQEETGTDLDTVDWKKYDPRSYDPRRIIKEALSEEAAAIQSTAAAATLRSDAVHPRMQMGAASPDEQPVTNPILREGPTALEPGQRAPFDDEAT
ncbi:Sec-independent protein translocase TatB [Micrococcoides hystricis]|uniref:Sec-independent protein translocase TatB n=1 Tax=Micrococcoides hystricis TaxID=1572761 RepID=A0ABV6P8D5_9MICC